MRLLLLTAGSRGDVEPFLALARRGVAAGHDVHLAVTREALAGAGATGAQVHGLDADYAALVAAQGISPWAAMRSYRTVVAPMLAALERSAARAVLDGGPDVVVAHPKVTCAPLAAARVGAPFVLAEIVPTLTPTRAFPAAGLPVRDLGPLNPLTFRVLRAGAAAVRWSQRGVRSELGLPAAAPPPARTVVPASPTLLPRPDDWPATATVTGRWHAPAPGPAEDPDPEATAFLAGGDVVYAGFGSMARGDARRRTREIVGAVRRRGLRALVVTGWGGLEVPADVAGADVLVRDAVDHDRVLPRCRAAIHHAGAGTAHAVVAAGLPSVPVPVIGDQPFWAARLHERGLATAPVPWSRLDADHLAAALDALPARDTVTAAGGRMSAEDGCGTTLALLERTVAGA